LAEAMTLREWMEANGLTDEALAQQLGVNRSLVTKWRRGDAMPNDTNKRLLFAATEGAVTPCDLLGLAVEEAA
jgi:transcriptional regulator with XRE-family HTH domain